MSNERRMTTEERIEKLENDVKVLQTALVKLCELTNHELNDIIDAITTPNN